MGSIKAAVLITLLIVFVGPEALAASEVGEAHAIIEAGTSRGTALRSSLEFHQRYSLSVLRLGESGQGFGVRMTLLPSPNSAGAWELSADAVARLANNGPLYLKVIGGGAWVSANGLWPPRVRAGAELGLTAIRSGVGLEAGIAAVYTFSPPRPGDGEWVISAGMGILFGFGAPSRAPVIARLKNPSTEQPATAASGYPSEMVLTRGVGGELGRPAAAAQRELQSHGFDERDVIQQLLLLQKPGSIMSWWASGPGEDVERWTHPPSEWERKYIETMSSSSVPEPIRMGPPVTPERLTPEQAEEANRFLGRGLAAAEGYSNWENRRRIVKHYVMTHPATIKLALGQYELARDSNPLFFALERGWQMASGKEMFTAQDVSRLGAAAEFFTMLATTVVGGKLMKAARPVAERSVQAPFEPVRSPGAPGQVIPLDRARAPRTPSSPAAQPLSSADEQPLAATGTDGSPAIRRQATPGNGPTIANLRRPGQETGRGAATPPSTSQSLRSDERIGGSGHSRPNLPPERSEAVASAGTGDKVSSLESKMGSTSSDPVKGHDPAPEPSAVRKVNGRVPIRSKHAGKTYPLENLPPSLRAKYPNSVKFTKEGFPDFKPYATKEIKVQGLTGNRTSDSALANRAAGLKETPAGYTWHHCEDAVTMQLVPSDLHSAVKHTGGAAILNNVEP